MQTQLSLKLQHTNNKCTGKPVILKFRNLIYFFCQKDKEHWEISNKTDNENQTFHLSFDNPMRSLSEISRKCPLKYVNKLFGITTYFNIKFRKSQSAKILKIIISFYELWKNFSQSDEGKKFWLKFTSKKHVD